MEVAAAKGAEVVVVEVMEVVDGKGRLVVVEMAVVGEGGEGCECSLRGGDGEGEGEVVRRFRVAISIISKLQSAHKTESGVQWRQGC